jgi:hypothetical protein
MANILSKIIKCRIYSSTLSILARGKGHGAGI